MSSALLVNWFDLPSESRAAFDGWHNRQHVIERLCIPGFDRGRRFESLDQPAPRGHGYLVIYDTESLDVLASPAYAARLDAPTPLTQSVVPLLRDLTRTAGEVVRRRGVGTGAFARTIRLPGFSGRLAQGGGAIDAAIDAVYACDSVTAVQVYRPDAGVTHFKDRTQEGRATDTLAREDYPWAVVIEACRADTLDSATTALRSVFSRHWPDADFRFQCHSYQLVFTMSAQQARQQSEQGPAHEAAA